VAKTNLNSGRVNLEISLNEKLLADSYIRTTNATHKKIYLHGLHDLIQKQGTDDDKEAAILLEIQENDAKGRELQENLEYIRLNKKIREKVIEPQIKEKTLAQIKQEAEDKEYERRRNLFLTRQWKNWRPDYERTNEIPSAILKQGNFRNQAHALSWLQAHDPS
jgi:hypothetical protein